MKAELIEYHRAESRHWKTMSQAASADVVLVMSKFHTDAVAWLEGLPQGRPWTYPVLSKAEADGGT